MFETARLAHQALCGKEKHQLIPILQARDKLLMQAEITLPKAALKGPFHPHFIPKTSVLGQNRAQLWHNNKQDATQLSCAQQKGETPKKNAPSPLWKFVKGTFVEVKAPRHPPRAVSITLTTKLAPYSQGEENLSRVTARLATLLVKNIQKTLKESIFASLIPFLPALDIRFDDPFFTALNAIFAQAEGLKQEKALLLLSSDAVLLNALATILTTLNPKIRLYVPLSLEMESLNLLAVTSTKDKPNFSALERLKALEIAAAQAETWLLGRPQDRNYITDIHALLYEFSKTVFFPTTLRTYSPSIIPNSHAFPEEVMRLFSPRLAKAAADFWRNSFVDKLLACAPPLERALFLYLEKLLRSLCGKLIPASLLALDYLHRAMLRDKPQRLICLPSRDWLARAACLIARAQGVISFDVQTVFVGPRSRYKPSLATYQLAIETYSQSLYCRYFGQPKAKVILAGGVRYSLMQRAIHSADGARIRATLPFNHVVFFAASPLYDKCAPVVAALVQALLALPTSGLTLRLHPSAPHEDEASFKVLLAPLMARGLILKAPLAESLAASDLVVTRYSNVGLEAALANIPVIACDLSTERPPIPLDEMGVALSATTAAALKNLVENFANGGTARLELATTRAAYLKQNPQLICEKPAFQLAQQIRNLS